MEKYTAIKVSKQLDNIQGMVLSLIIEIENECGSKDKKAKAMIELLDEINEKLNEGLEM
jgi:uncharacterized membrane protein YukC